MADNRTCIVDLKEYKYCPHCGGYDSNETWRFIYCSENCRRIDNVLQRYASGKISELEAQDEFEKLDMSNANNFHKVTKKTLDKIYSVKKKKVVEKTALVKNANEQCSNKRKKKNVSNEKIDE